jgi:hypothetical protein
MVHVATIDVSGGAPGNGEQFGDGGLAAPVLKALVRFAEGLLASTQVSGTT